MIWGFLSRSLNLLKSLLWPSANLRRGEVSKQPVNKSAWISPLPEISWKSDDTIIKQMQCSYRVVIYTWHIKPRLIVNNPGCNPSVLAAPAHIVLAPVWSLVISLMASLTLTTLAPAPTETERHEQSLNSILIGTNCQSFMFCSPSPR